MNRKPKEYEHKAFVGIYHEPLVSEAREELDEKSRGQWKGRTMMECRRGYLWMIRRCLTGRRDE